MFLLHQLKMTIRRVFSVSFCEKKRTAALGAEGRVPIRASVKRGEEIDDRARQLVRCVDLGQQLLEDLRNRSFFRGFRMLVPSLSW